MKKHFILVAVIGVLIAVGCSSPYSENIDEPIREDNKKAKEVIITATFDNQSDVQTKTVLNAEGKVEWLPADEIVIFSDGESAKFTSINTENARKANFRGTISFVTGATEGSDPDAFVYGLYPYDANATATGGVITTTIPTAQIGLAGSFADDLALAVAKSVSTNLSFKNAYSGIDFEFSEEGYETVTLSSNNGEPIAGAVTISFGSDGVPVTTVDANGSSSITLTAPGGGTFETEKRYYILCAPQTLNGGYTLTAEKSTGRAVFERASKKEFKRNVLTDVSGYLNERGTFESLNITFADANVKAICVAPATGWDTNGDGELSYTEAAAVTSIPYGVFSENTTITSFDEFQYFTSVTSLGYERSNWDDGYDYYGAFYGCSALESIVLPSSLTDISHGAFWRCSSLEEITIPSTVTRIGIYAFYMCTNLDVIMESATPCTLYKDSYNSHDEPYSFGDLQSGTKVKAIYVPTQESVSTYKAATYWSTYSSIIKWIGERVPLVAAVDLGLPSGLKWASFNVGANAPEDYGEYFAWGETSPKENYEWSNYFDTSDGGSTFTKYNKDGGKTVLDLENDAANANWGGSWRMPTDAEWTELRTECAWTWTAQNEKNGYLVTGPNGNSIFLPAAGDRSGTSLRSAGSKGYYWSSSLDEDDSYRARLVYFNSGEVYRVSGYRYYGSSVRPVTE